MTTNAGPAAPLTVLLVEDDPGDVVLTREVLAEHDLPCELHVARDGTEALALLRAAGPDGPIPRPDLVLLDLNLPGLDGREVLAEIRADASLTHLPVVVLSTSSSPEDVLASYRLHATAFVTKPSDYREFAEAVREVRRFFGEVVRLP